MLCPSVGWWMHLRNARCRLLVAGWLALFAMYDHEHIIYPPTKLFNFKEITLSACFLYVLCQHLNWWFSLLLYSNIFQCWWFLWGWKAINCRRTLKGLRILKRWQVSWQTRPGIRFTFCFEEIKVMLIITCMNQQVPKMINKWLVKICLIKKIKYDSVQDVTHTFIKHQWMLFRWTIITNVALFLSDSFHCAFVMMKSK